MCPKKIYSTSQNQLGNDRCVSTNEICFLLIFIRPSLDAFTCEMYEDVISCMMDKINF